jgi:hypothetical protein
VTVYADGIGSRSSGNDRYDHWLGDLNPQKARVLLALALTRTNDPFRFERSSPTISDDHRQVEADGSTTTSAALCFSPSWTD